MHEHVVREPAVGAVAPTDEPVRTGAVEAACTTSNGRTTWATPRATASPSATPVTPSPAAAPSRPPRARA